MSERDLGERRKERKEERADDSMNFRIGLTWSVNLHIFSADSPNPKREREKRKKEKGKKEGEGKKIERALRSLPG